jgi:hypothetical protein
VAWLQFQLNQNGALLAVDGILGKKTLIAVAAYHDANGHEGYEKKLRPGKGRETERGSPSMSADSEILDSN